MDLQSKPMTGAVEKPVCRPSRTSVGKPRSVKNCLHFLVQFQAIDAGLHFLQRQRLASLHRFPKPPLLFAGAAAHHRSRHVAVIAAVAVARENIENDEEFAFSGPKPRSCGSHA